MTRPPSPVPPTLRGAHVTKGTAFTAAERDAFGLRGLLPPRVLTMAERPAG